MRDYLRRPSLPITARYFSRSVWRRYLSRSARWLTNFSNPRRLEKSFLCARMCSVRELIRFVSSAICTSGEPVSESLRRNCVMSSDFSSFVIDIVRLRLRFPPRRTPASQLRNDVSYTHFYSIYAMYQHPTRRQGGKNAVRR